MKLILILGLFCSTFSLVIEIENRSARTLYAKSSYFPEEGFKSPYFDVKSNDTELIWIEENDLSVSGNIQGLILMAIDGTLMNLGVGWQMNLISSDNEAANQIGSYYGMETNVTKIWSDIFLNTTDLTPTSSVFKARDVSIGVISQVLSDGTLLQMSMSSTQNSILSIRLEENTRKPSGTYYIQLKDSNLYIRDLFSSLFLDYKGIDTDISFQWVFNRQNSTGTYVISPVTSNSYCWIDSKDTTNTQFIVQNLPCVLGDYRNKFEVTQIEGDYYTFIFFLFAVNTNSVIFVIIK